ncbi:hypothetical protein [Tsukamurella tyrosinosolvens]|uniref:hypothetical protein n=1 Tax=Tsukamurella tyrosinosolvens TaxID=57704 RepID=UPI003462EBE5
MSKKVEAKHAVICAKAETARLEHLIDGHWKPAVERLEAQVVRLTEERNAALSALADYERLDRVESAEELEALPHQSVVIEEPHGHVWIRHSDKWHCSCDGTSVEWSSDEVFGDLGCGDQPLTVLWTPEETPE